MLLAINTCLRKVEVSLIDEESMKISYDKSEESEREHTEKVFEFIKEALKKSSSSDAMSKPDKVLVVTGPGAFTSVRVGVTVANTIAFAINAEGPQSDLYAVDIITLFDQEEKILPIYLSAGKSEIYKIESHDKFIAMNSEEFFLTVDSEFYGDLSEYHITLLKNPRLFVNRKLTLGEAVLKLIKSGKLDECEVEASEHEVVHVKPTYLKAPNISVSKKEI